MYHHCFLCVYNKYQFSVSVRKSVNLMGTDHSALMRSEIFLSSGLGACATRDAQTFLAEEAAIVKVLNEVTPKAVAEVVEAEGRKEVLEKVQGSDDVYSISSCSPSRSTDPQVMCVSSRKRPRPNVEDDAVLQQPEDEAELFGRVLAHHMRNCPGHMVLQMQMAMLDTVSRFTS